MKQITPALFIVLILQVSGIWCNAQTKSQKQREQDEKELDQQIFPGAKLAANYKFDFPDKFEEKFISTKDGIKLNALVFKTDSSKGVVFYLHGSNDALNIWGKIAQTYTSLHYDVIMPDYRGYGKSEGKISSEEQVYSDVQDVYNYVMLTYSEKKIIILGYSIGTGPAAMLAAGNHPKMLILQAPYYSLTDWIQNVVPSIDTSIITYKFNTYQFLQKTSAPVVIFHGDADEAIYYGSSQKLKAFFKPGDELITLKGQGHSRITENKDYLKALKTILR